MTMQMRCRAAFRTYRRQKPHHGRERGGTCVPRNGPVAGGMDARRSAQAATRFAAWLQCCLPADVSPRQQEVKKGGRRPLLYPPSLGLLRVGAPRWWRKGEALRAFFNSPSVAPDALEPTWRGFGVTRGALDVVVSQVVLQRSRVASLVGDVMVARMPAVYEGRSGSRIGPCRALRR
jgi:hypothetical protein